MGRFITEDTYYGSLLESQTQNLYLYVTNNPLKYVDPTGHYRVAYIDQSAVDIVMEDGDDIEEIVKLLYDTPYMLEHVMEFNVLKDLKDLHVGDHILFPISFIIVEEISAESIYFETINIAKKLEMKGKITTAQRCEIEEIVKNPSYDMPKIGFRFSLSL